MQNNAKTQKRKNAKTQKRKNAKTQKRKNAKTLVLAFHPKSKPFSYTYEMNKSHAPLRKEKTAKGFSFGHKQEPDRNRKASCENVL